MSSQEKWDYVLAKMPTDILNDISDVVDSLTNDTPNPYELVKNRLLETYIPTRWQLTRQLLSFLLVSGLCPTTLMNQLLSLLPEGDHPETMFLLLFLDRLPPHISSQLTTRTFRHPRDMAVYADQIWDSTLPPPAQQVAALSSQPPLHHWHPPCLCGLSPALAAATPQHPAAARTTATTTSGLERLPITARLPVPGWARGQETAPQPVDYKHHFHRQLAVTSQG